MILCENELLIDSLKNKLISNPVQKGPILHSAKENLSFVEAFWLNAQDLTRRATEKINGV